MSRSSQDPAARLDFEARRISQDRDEWCASAGTPGRMQGVREGACSRAPIAFAAPGVDTPRF